ncbi:MAG: SRPBCC family protein [Burkholderiales bacterium]
MQLEQRFRLSAPAARTWPAFHDVPLLVSCLPGASLEGPEQDGVWPLRFEVRLGPIAASFAGTGRLALDDAARSGRFEGQAADRKTQSRVKGAAAFALAEDETGGTEVSVSIDYALTGALAQFGRAGIVRELATALTAQFAQSLQARLAALEPAAASDAAATGSEPAGNAAPHATGTAAPVAAPAPGPVPPPSPAAAPLALGPLLWAALRARLARLLGLLGLKS